MPLRQRQLDALTVLEWLIDPTVRASGRTLAMAVAAIRVACQNPGTYVDVLDHGHVLAARENLFQVLRDLIRADFRLSPHATFATDRTRFSIALPTPLRNWLPTEAVLSGRSAAEQGRASGERLREQATEEMRRFRSARELELEDHDREMDMISPEMAERLDLDLAAAMKRQNSFKQDPEVQKPAPKKPKVPKPKSAWDRLLADKDD